jgi:hypothetical protein
MARYTQSQYRRQMLVLMAVYVALMLFAWPQVHTAPLPLRFVLALAPVLPVVAVIVLLAKRVMHSDELEQRVHMLALSVATALVATLSLVGGFLCAAGVLGFSGDVLIWVVPLLSVAYGGMRWWLGRRYGGVGCE